MDTINDIVALAKLTEELRDVTQTIANLRKVPSYGTYKITFEYDDYRNLMEVNVNPRIDTADFRSYLIQSMEATQKSLKDQITKLVNANDTN